MTYLYTVFFLTYHGTFYLSFFSYYLGFREPHVNPVYKNLSVAVGASMWLWLFYRAKHDGAALLVRI